MAQPVYVVPPPSDDLDFLGTAYGAPFAAAWLYICAQVWDGLGSVHPVFRILLIATALTVVLLQAFRPARLSYAAAVAIVGSVLIFGYAPDTIWKVTFEMIFLPAWAAIALNFEGRRASEEAASIRATASSAQNTAPS